MIHNRKDCIHNGKIQETSAEICKLARSYCSSIYAEECSYLLILVFRVYMYAVLRQGLKTYRKKR